MNVESYYKKYLAVGDFNNIKDTYSYKNNHINNTIKYIILDFILRYNDNNNFRIHYKPKYNNTHNTEECLTICNMIDINNNLCLYSIDIKFRISPSVETLQTDRYINKEDIKNINVERGVDVNDTLYKPLNVKERLQNPCILFGSFQHNLRVRYNLINEVYNIRDNPIHKSILRHKNSRTNHPIHYVPYETDNLSNKIKNKYPENAFSTVCNPYYIIKMYNIDGLKNITSYDIATLSYNSLFSYNPVSQKTLERRKKLLNACVL